MSQQPTGHCPLVPAWARSRPVEARPLPWERPRWYQQLSPSEAPRQSLLIHLLGMGLPLVSSGREQLLCRLPPRQQVRVRDPRPGGPPVGYAEKLLLMALWVLGPCCGDESWPRHGRVERRLWGRLPSPRWARWTRSGSHLAAHLAPDPPRESRRRSSPELVRPRRPGQPPIPTLSWL